MSASPSPGVPGEGRGEGPSRNRGEGFVSWLIGIIRRNQTDPAALSAMVQQSTAAGVEQCLRFGVTCAGDISKHCHLSRPVLRNSPLRVVSFGEVQGMAQRRGLLDQRLALARDATDATDQLVIGLSPHAPYSIEPEGYRRCLELARAHHMPLATHLAESDAETPFLADHSGPFRQLWDFIGGWDDVVPTFVGGPVRFAQQLGLLDYPFLLAHVNYCDDEELAILAASQASVVYCPRTHAFFGHPPHRWREMLASGINVAVGTDSCASSPDLNLLDDLRLLHELAPEVPAHTLWEMATIRAARAIRQDAHVGTLTPGKQADLIAFPALGPDPLAGLLEQPALPIRVWIRGVALR